MHRAFTSLLFLSLLFLSKTSLAFRMPESHPFPLVCIRADFILVANVESFVSDNDLPPTDESDQVAQLMWMSANKPAGTTTFRIIKSIKGSLEGKCALHLPIVASYYYGGRKFPIEKGKKFLLFLTKSDTGLEPTDPTRPLIPLSADAVIPAGLKADIRSDRVETDVVDSLLASCADKTIRRIETIFLKDMTNSHIPVGLHPYVNDEDLMTRNDVLYCLIHNQQLSAIPLMVDLNKTMALTGGGSSMGALEDLSSKKALLYLNPLLIDDNALVRQEAAATVKNIGDKSSLPNMVRALDMPEYQGVTHYDLYAGIHRLAPELGAAKDMIYFSDNGDAEIAIIKAWWAKKSKAH